MKSPIEKIADMLPEEGGMFDKELRILKKEIYISLASLVFLAIVLMILLLKL